MTGFVIDYERIVARFLDQSSNGTARDRLDAYHEFLLDELPHWWCQTYKLMPNNSVEIVEFNHHDVRFLFDLAAERVVAAFNLSKLVTSPRDVTRMSSFARKSTSVLVSESPVANSCEAPGPRELAGMTFRDRFFRLYGDRYDRGHFISHTQGGGLDVNLFPQFADINQGRSALGRLYRSMERRCSSRPGVFCFSRPIYDDITWVPFELEYGVVEDVQIPDVRVFPNRPPK